MLVYISQIILLTVLSVFCINSGLYIKHDYENESSTKTNSTNIYRGDNLEIQTEYVSEDLSNLLHMDYKKAVNYLKKRFPTIKLEIIPDNISVLNDYDNNRIYLFYNEDTNLISKIPYIG